jgi:outer membrane protein assembly factor BamB
MTAKPPFAIAALAAVALSACSSTGGVNLWPFSDGPSKSTEPREGRITILAFEQKLEADPELAGVSLSLPPQTPVANWTQPGGPADNAPDNMQASGAFAIAWRRDIGAGSSDQLRLTAPPVVADGRIYALDADQSLTALDLKDGRQLWRRDLRPTSGSDRQGIGGGVAFADGRLYVTSGLGYMAALNAADGREIWRAESRVGFHAAPTVSGGRVFAVTNDSELVAVDALTGAIQWNFQAIAEPARILSASSPAVDGDLVIAPFASGELAALLAPNGRRLWTDALTRAGRLTSLSAINDIAGRPVVKGGFVYAASHSGILAAIDQRTGQRAWARGFASTQTPLVVGDALFAVSVDGDLAAIERTTGRIQWVRQLPRFVDETNRQGRIAWTGPTLAASKLVLASSEGDAVVIDPATGQTDRTFKLGGKVFIPPIAAGGTVFMLTDDATLIALR